MVAYKGLGASLHVRYPSWRAYAMDAEPPPHVLVDRAVDDGSRPDVSFGRVFVCRSGAWTPPWLDEDFRSFVAAAPVRRRIVLASETIDPMVPREYREAAEWIAQARAFAGGGAALMEELTNETARALPRPGRGGCAGYPGENKPHDRHHLGRLPIRDRLWGEPRESEIARARARWRGVTDGRTCFTCYAVYDPTPMCEQVDTDPISKIEGLCGSPARFVESGSTSFHATVESALRERANPAEAHYFCGKHAPSQIARRLTARADRRAEEERLRKARSAPYDDLRDAREALVQEAARWRDDEAAIDGFCVAECEHHECRLARAVARLERAAAAARRGYQRGEASS